MPAMTEFEVLEHEVGNLLDRVAKLESQMKQVETIAGKAMPVLEAHLKDQQRVALSRRVVEPMSPLQGEQGPVGDAENYVNTFGR